MISSQAVIDAVLTLLKQKVDPAHVADLARWKRAEILQRCNLVQDSLALQLPGLFDGNNSTLLTVAGQMEYTLPASVGMIREVAIDGIQLSMTTKTQIQGDSIRGDLIDNTEFVLDWASVQDQPNTWFQDNEKTIVGLYPVPVISGQVISIDCELLIAYMADTGASYPLGNLNALRKAQQIIIYRAAEMCAAEVGNMNFVGYLKGIGDELVNSLTTYWFVLRPSPAESTIRFKETEGANNITLHHNLR